MKLVSKITLLWLRQPVARGCAWMFLRPGLKILSSTSGRALMMTRSNMLYLPNCLAISTSSRETRGTPEGEGVKLTQLNRGDEVEFIVTGARHYGVLVETIGGEKGWIEAEYLSVSNVPSEAWPSVGTRMRGLVLGYTKEGEGRIRIAMRAVDGRPAPETWPR
jgi:hypothetical protein